jgi:hypothetical protein
MEDSRPLTLYAALLRAFTTASVPGEPHQCLTEDPQKAANIAARVTEAFIKEAGVRACASERRRCISLLRAEVTIQRVIGAEVPGPDAEEAAARAAACELALGLLESRADGLAVGEGGAEAEVRADERRRVAGILRDRSAEMVRADRHYGATVARRLANEIDPLGPVMGAPASGGTT